MTFSKKNIEPEFLQLVNKFPEIFLYPSEKVLEIWEKNKGVSMPEDRDDLCSLRYGFEHDSGWVGILDEFCSQCSEILKENKDAKITAFIVKEKFGSLRWQGHTKNLTKEQSQRYNQLVCELSQKSLETCEVSGKSGKLCVSKDGWSKTLCSEQAERLGYVE